MNGNRFATVFVLSAILLTAPCAFAEDAAYTAVEGWPKLPAGFEFGEVAGVAVDSHNHVFIFHRGDEMPVMCVEGETGKIVSSFGEGLFKNAHGLCVDGQDNVWVTDNGHHQVFKFTHDGELLMTLGEQGEKDWDETHFNQPTDIIVAPNGEFYVTDGYVNSRVAKFSAEGKFLMEWGSKGAENGQFNLPHGIARDNEGRIYVADRSNRRIQVFSDVGEHLHTWAEKIFGKDGRPWGLEFAPDGFLYVIDGGQVSTKADHGRLRKLDLNGKLVAEWSSYGTEPGQLKWGHDVAVGRDGAVYTAEVRYNNRPQKWVPAPAK